MRYRIIALATDNDYLAGALAARFRVEAWVTRRYTGGIGAHRHLPRERADVAILDLPLSGGCGFDLLKALKSEQLTRDMPVLLLSETRSAADLRQAQELGAAAFLPKPCSAELLVRRVRREIEAVVGHRGAGG